ncbi:MAG TPA: helix-turn-helix transcriptional regulator [Terriglobia bacterium]|nr:helix-turn-helix transcriptional regulator [Terriglobia bacterium]
MNIGTTLHSLRTAKGYSQGDIEKRTGLLRCYLSCVENGHTVPNLETLRKWAAALDVEMYQLFFEGEGKPEATTQKGAGELGREERKMVEAFKSLDNEDKKIAVALLRKMANQKKRAKRAG